MLKLKKDSIPDMGGIFCLNVLAISLPKADVLARRCRQNVSTRKLTLQHTWNKSILVRRCCLLALSDEVRRQILSDSVDRQCKHISFSNGETSFLIPMLLKLYAKYIVCMFCLFIQHKNTPPWVCSMLHSCRQNNLDK